MNPSMSDIPLNDIQPLVEVPDYSIYLFAGVSAVILILAASLFLFLLKKLRNRRKNERHIAYEALKTIDFSDPKRAAYEISRIGLVFSKDNERSTKGYRNLFERLEPYKYAPHVKPIDEETLGYYRLYLEMIES